jgi:hypothetical protein
VRGGFRARVRRVRAPCPPRGDATPLGQLNTVLGIGNDLLASEGLREACGARTWSLSAACHGEAVFASESGFDTAVAEDVGAGEVAGSFARAEGEDFGDLFWATVALQRSMVDKTAGFTRLF